MTDSKRIDMQEQIRALCALPPRLAGGEGERRAHEHVAGVLRELGYAPEVEEFRAITNGYARLAAHCGALALAGSLGITSPRLATLLAGGANLSLWGDLEARGAALSRLLPHGTSRNVVARLPAAKERRRCAVLMAHVDAAREGPAVFFEPRRARAAAALFHEKLGHAPNPVQIVFWAGVVQTALHAGASVGIPTQLATWALAQLQGWVALTMGRAALGPAVPGASDDAAGVAVLLALAEDLAAAPLEHTEVWFVATGCEESGLAGAVDLLERHAGELDRERTWLLALDTLGSGTLRWCTGEGFVRFLPYDGSFVALARETATEPGAPASLPYAMTFGTDALAGLVRGYKSLSLIALDDAGYPPHYHWRSDTPENIDPATPAAAREFTRRLLRRLDARDA
ncbi:MAG: M28 family peptidase [Deltaproteobacteria bacterium]|nr:M28 family peptidase [Deltaproteobacteria bacterium]